MLYTTVCITHNHSSGSPLWHSSCVLFWGTCNVHCCVHRHICIHGCGSSFCSCIALHYGLLFFLVSRLSFFSWIVPSSPSTGHWRSPPLPPRPPPSRSPPRLGPLRSSRFGMYRQLSASVTLAVKETMSVWAVERADDSDGDDGLNVLIVAGTDLSLRLVSSLTLSMKSSRILFISSKYCSCCMIFNAMSLNYFC